MTSETRYLLHTNAISHMMRDPLGPVAQRAFAIEAQNGSSAMCTCVIVQCELLFRLARRSSPKWTVQYQRVMESLEVMPLEATVSTHYARLRTHLKQQGTPIGANDTLIAAHALALGATLVSTDADFLRVPGLTVENWLTQK